MSPHAQLNIFVTYHFFHCEENTKVFKILLERAPLLLGSANMVTPDYHTISLLFFQVLR